MSVCHCISYIYYLVLYLCLSTSWSSVWFDLQGEKSSSVICCHVSLQTFLYIQVFGGNGRQREGEFVKAAGTQCSSSTLYMSIDHLFTAWVTQDKVTGNLSSNGDTSGFERRSSGHSTWDGPFEHITINYFSYLVKLWKNVILLLCVHLSTVISNCCIKTIWLIECIKFAIEYYFKLQFKKSILIFKCYISACWIHVILFECETHWQMYKTEYH